MDGIQNTHKAAAVTTIAPAPAAIAIFCRRTLLLRSSRLSARASSRLRIRFSNSSWLSALPFLSPDVFSFSPDIGFILFSAVTGLAFFFSFVSTRFSPDIGFDFFPSAGLSFPAFFTSDGCFSKTEIPLCTCFLARLLLLCSILPILLLYYTSRRRSVF